MKKFEEIYMYSTSPRHVAWYGGKIQAMIFFAGAVSWVMLFWTSHVRIFQVVI